MDNKEVTDAQVYNDSLPWIEKYRPKSIDQIIGHTNIINTLKNFLDKKTLPHLLLYGSAGTGKTSLIHSSAHQLYEQRFKFMTLELNASDERGIEIVRKQLKDFASTSAINGQVKLIILDEVDSMTYDAQSALRRMIETYTRNVRFCLICNYINRIIPALQSRCTAFRFLPLDKSQVISKITEIANAEKIKISEEAIESIYTLSAGDLRKAINILQSASANNITEITKMNIYACTGNPLPSQIEDIYNILCHGSFAESYKKIQEIITDNEYSVIVILKFMHQCLIDKFLRRGKSTKVENLAKVIYRLSQIEYYLTTKTNANIQLAAMIGTFKMFPLE